MRIESILRRPGGTRVKLGGVEYHFKPDAEGREFCDVSNPEHAQKLLAIREGYRLVENAKGPELPLDAPSDDLLNQETLQPAEGESEEAKPAKEVPVDDRAYWSKQYEAKFGKKPPSRWKAERIRVEVEAE